MKIILTYLPFIISILTGYLLIRLILKDEKNIPLSVQFFLGSGLGAGINSYIAFSSFILVSRYSQSFIILLNCFIFLIILFWFFKKGLKIFCKGGSHILWPYLLLIPLLIPIIIQAKFYPLGGWDAWSVWNFKSKFLFLSAENWKTIFSPLLWRSSPHYPLLLPMFNVWGYSFLGEASNTIPLVTSIFFTLATAGLLFAGLKDITKSNFSILAPLTILTIPFYLLLTTSQYSDVVLGFYLLSSFYCIVKTKLLNNRTLYFLSGVFIGIMSFSKGEGTLSALILLVLCVPYFTLKNPSAKQNLILFFIGFFIGALPSIIFNIFYAPKNITMINGLISQTNPSTLLRLKTILSYFFLEVISPKWNGVLLVCISGIIFLFKKAFYKDYFLLPLFFFFYIVIIILYYYINTYFEIVWWLSVSYSRIIFALIPSLIFWTFLQVFSNNKKMP